LRTTSLFGSHADVILHVGNILEVGADGTVPGGDVGAVGIVEQKDVGAFDTVEQKDVVAAGTVWNSWFCPNKFSFSAVSHQSSDIIPGLEVIDPMLEVGDDRCSGDINSSPGCAASHPHEYTTVGAVPSGTVSDPDVKKPLRHNFPETSESESVSDFANLRPVTIEGSQ